MNAARMTKPATWVSAVAATILVAAAAPAAATPSAGPANVPAEFVSAVNNAPLHCGHPEITSELVAAEVEADSGWNVAAVSGAGAEGPAQLFPAVFDIYGADDDGNGVASPFDIGDAIGALVRLGCANVTALKAAGRSVGPVSIIAANVGGLGGVDNAEVRAQAQQIWDGQ